MQISSLNRHILALYGTFPASFPRKVPCPSGIIISGSLKKNNNSLGLFFLRLKKKEKEKRKYQA